MLSTCLCCSRKPRGKYFCVGLYFCKGVGGFPQISCTLVKRQQELHILTIYMNLAKEDHMEHRQVLAQSADEFERGRGKMEAGEEQMARRLIDLGEGARNALFAGGNAGEAEDLLPGQVFQSLKNVNSAVGEVPFLSGMVEEAVNYDQVTAGYREVFKLGFRMGYEAQKKESMMVESKFTKLKHSLMQKELGEGGRRRGGRRRWERGRKEVGGG